MDKLDRGADKTRNEWPKEIYERLNDKTVKPQNLLSRDRVDFTCDIHGPFSRPIDKVYNDFNTVGYLRCPICDRAETRKKVEQTNLERYGTKAPAQNPNVLNKMKATNLERYGFETVGSNPDFAQKIKQVNLEKYGVTSAISNPDIKEKANKTMLEKYGTIHALQNEESFNKFKTTMQDRYGADFSLQNEDIRNKFTQTMKEKYGNEHALQNEELKQRMKDTTTKNRVRNYEDYVKLKMIKGEEPIREELFDIMNDRKMLSNYIDYLTNLNGIAPTMKQLSDIFKCGLSIIALKIIKFELESKLQFIGEVSYSEYEIMDFLDSFSINYKPKCTKLGPELDIYIEEHDLGINFNNLYLHSNIFKDKSDNFNISDYYAKIGIKVIHIYEDEWYNIDKREMIKSVILSACNISVNKTIEYTGQLKLIEFDHSPPTLNIVRDFYDKNNLQGYRNSAIHIALVDENDEIMECMSFGYPYFGNMKNKTKYQYELIRHCTKIYHNIEGGKERLFEYFLTNHPYDNNFNNYIIAYCDMDKFNGKIYEKLGFKYADHQIQVWGLEDSCTRRVFRNPSDNEHFKTLSKIYGCGNNVYIYNP